MEYKLGETGYSLSLVFTLILHSASPSQHGHNRHLCDFIYCMLPLWEYKLPKIKDWVWCTSYLSQHPAPCPGVGSRSTAELVASRVKLPGFKVTLWPQQVTFHKDSSVRWECMVPTLTGARYLIQSCGIKCQGQSLGNFIVANTIVCSYTNLGGVAYTQLGCKLMVWPLAAWLQIYTAYYHIEWGRQLQHNGKHLWI
jgi:hypothetical protein